MHTTLPKPVDLAFQAEIGTDADTGNSWLIADTGDGYEETTPTRLRAHVQHMREQLENAERLADHYEAIQGLNTLAAEHGVTVEEWDTSTLDQRLRDGFVGWYAEINGKPLLVFPLGQDPVTRLAVARDLLDRKAVA